MDLITVLIISIGLAMDAFAVSVSNGCVLKKVHWPAYLKTAGFFGFFQAFMPVVGWIVGVQFSHYIEMFDHWMAFGMLTFLGAKMAYEGLSHDEEADDDSPKKNPVATFTLFVMAIATSIDALVVGVSFAFLQASIVFPVICIGLVTFAMSVAGVHIGVRFGKRFNFPVEVVGGLILFAIGLKILVEHLWF